MTVSQQDRRRSIILRLLCRAPWWQVPHFWREYGRVR